jgi:transcriptional regulator GlxA family with amidase domain
MARHRQSRSNVKLRDGEDRSGMRLARRVVIVGVPPVRALDVFGPAEVFGDANWLRGGDPSYKVTIISACRERLVPSYIETPLHTDQTFREFRGPLDTLLVAGSVGQMRYEPDFLGWLREQSAKARRFGSICTGALMLAKAGLLDGRRATTHWNWCDELARDYPKVKVDPTPIYVREGNCYTSAGVIAGIDLALALVEEDLGRAIALRVAQMMVVFLRRPAGQSQFSATLAAQTSENHSLGDLIAWLADNLTADLSIEKLARRAAMSPRNFARLFRQEMRKTPAKHIEDLRLEAARRHLESGSRSLEEVANANGFASAEILRRVFRRRLGVTPGQYRASFGRTGLH